MSNGTVVPIPPVVNHASEAVINFINALAKIMSQTTTQDIIKGVVLILGVVSIFMERLRENNVTPAQLLLITNALQPPDEPTPPPIQ